MVAAPEPQRLTNARRFLVHSAESRFEDAAAVLSPVVVYTVPGHHRLAGVFRGPEEVVRHVAALVDFSRGTFEVLQWVDWLVGDEHVAALQYAQAQNSSRIYRGHHLYLLSFDTDDLVSGITVYFGDPAAAERFFG